MTKNKKQIESYDYVCQSMNLFLDLSGFKNLTGLIELEYLQ